MIAEKDYRYSSLAAIEQKIDLLLKSQRLLCIATKTWMQQQGTWNKHGQQLMDEICAAVYRIEGVTQDDRE